MRIPFTSSARARRGAFVATAAAVATVGLASSALAGDPTGIYADFKDCPLDNPATATCIYSTVPSGSFKLGNKTVPIDKTITLQGGLTTDGQWIDAKGGRNLSETPLEVPGGLAGITNPGGVTGELLGPLLDAIDTFNGVTATAELTAQPSIDLAKFVNGNGTALHLPLRVRLANPFLGSNCYIGTTSSPVDLNLTVGTTAPPAPNTPITGSPGTRQYFDRGGLIVQSNFSLVDNAFGVGAISSTACGYFPLRLLTTAAVNATVGLPAAGGKNTAIQNGQAKIGSAAKARASIPTP